MGSHLDSIRINTWVLVIATIVVLAWLHSDGKVGAF